jgi:hypothetical protein
MRAVVARLKEGTGFEYSNMNVVVHDQQSLIAKSYYYYHDD